MKASMNDSNARPEANRVKVVSDLLTDGVSTQSTQAPLASQPRILPPLHNPLRIDIDHFIVLDIEVGFNQRRISLVYSS